MQRHKGAYLPWKNKADVDSHTWWHNIAVLFWVISQESPEIPHIDVTREDAKPLHSHQLVSCWEDTQKHFTSWNCSDLSFYHCRPKCMPLRFFIVLISAWKELGVGDRLLPTLLASLCYISKHCHMPTTLARGISLIFHQMVPYLQLPYIYHWIRYAQKHPDEHAVTHHLMLSCSPGKALVICHLGWKSNCR